MFSCIFLKYTKNLSILRWSNFPDLVGEEQLNLTSTGLIMNGAVWVKTFILSQISHRQSHFESLKQYYFGKPYICLGVQSRPEDQGDFGQGLTVNIS